MRIKTIVLNHKQEARYESALGEEMSEEQFVELKECMSQQMPLNAMNLETKDGDQVYFGPDFLKESVIIFEKIQGVV